MTPRDLDTQIVVRRLLLLDELLDDLRRVADDPDRLTHDRLARRGIERVLTQLVELASDINGHIAATRLHSSPGSYRDSFTLAARAGVISDELAADLLPSVGLRNVLVHEYVDVDAARVVAAVPLAAAAYGRYVAGVRDWLTDPGA
ncbi:type VII toxin-antitoxin system HepT family RNase toxin [Agilicoccus flavus]|uniref:type VII toxin-antitoxin system HepT family RNase toxin n=1 Tax=Agilicoccus flavus TaxID=2775968 RepID=UPI001CF6FB45|nr:DUF86 domain-containing protein [Agilicoccus flavus]